MERSMRCYVLIPNIKSMRSPNNKNSSLGGKLGAQLHHAGFQCFKYKDHPDVIEYLEQGIQQGADHFNVCITLDAPSIKFIENTIKTAKELGMVADLVIDPSYPMFIDDEVIPFLDTSKITVVPEVKQNGKTLTTREQVTCGWIIGDANDPQYTNLVSSLKLAK